MVDSLVCNCSSSVSSLILEILDIAILQVTIQGETNIVKYLLLHNAHLHSISIVPTLFTKLRNISIY